jgi:hypothetical protein
MNKFLEDNHGNKSSKRLCGSIILGMGIVGSVVLFCKCFNTEIKDAQTALAIIQAFLTSGSALLGFGVVEFFAKKNDK